MQWTFKDYQNGDCELHMVNTSKPDDQQQPVEPGQPDDLDSQLDQFGEDDDLPGSIMEKAKRLFRKDAAGFIAKHPSVANKLLEIDKVELERKKAEPQRKPANQMTAAELEELLMNRSIVLRETTVDDLICHVEQAIGQGMEDAEKAALILWLRDRLK